MVELLAIDSNGNYSYLDLSQDISIPYNKSIEDLEDITARKGGYTKTFNIFGSAKNDKFFQSAFNVNATDFDNTLQTGCVIQYKGSDVFNGTMRLNKITNEGGLVNYEVYLVENITSFASELEQVGLCDLDYSDIQHDIDYDSISSTWEYSGGTYDSYSGLTGKVIYPLAQTGYDEGQTFGTFNFSSTGFTNSNGNPIQTTQFKPWLNVKYIIDKIFDRTIYTYKSEFFDTQYFKSIFMLAGSSDTMGATSLEDRPDNQNFFQVTQSPVPLYVYDYVDLDSWKYIIFGGEEYDYLDRYTLSTFPSVPGQAGATNFFSVPVGGLYQFNFLMSYYSSYFLNPSFIDFSVRDIDTGVELAKYSGYPLLSNTSNVDLYFNLNLTKNQRIAMFIKGTESSFNDIAITSSELRLYSSPVLSTTGATMNWFDNISCDVSAVDYIKNIVNYFNLVMIPTGQDTFVIEPFSNYISSASGNTYDWSDKLNLDDTYTIEPLDFSLQRKLNLTYQPDETNLGTFWQNNYNNIFGEYIYNSPNPLLSGSQDIEFIFNSLPSNTVDNTNGVDFVVPHLFQFGRDGNNNLVEEPLSLPPRLGFYAGMKIPYSGSTPITWYIQDGLNTIEETKYPVVNRLSQLTYTGSSSSISDINMKNVWDYWMGNSTMVGYTPNSVFNNFYKQPIETLYSNEARLFTGYFYLTPDELKDIQFNDMVYFLNAQWRLLEIVDGDITEPSIVKCKLLKVPYRTPSTTPVPPDYVKQQLPKTTPTPTPTPIVAYPYSREWDFNVECPDCDVVGTQIDFYSPSSSLGAGALVYNDSTLLSPLSPGRYIKDPGTFSIYEIVSNAQLESELSFICQINQGC